MMRPKILLAALILAVPQLLPLSLAWSANLGAIYQLARDNDAKLAAAREARNAGQEKIPQGKAGLLPAVNLTANLRHNETDTSLSPSNSYGSHGFVLALVQPIYRKQNLEFYEQSKLQALLSEQQLKLAEQELMLRVAGAYFDILLAQDTLATAQSQKQAFAEQLAQARKSFEVGAATITESR